MQVHFRTKEESNRAQEGAFLKLSPSERFFAFLDLMYRLKDFPTKTDYTDKKDNFLIEIKSKS